MPLPTMTQMTHPSPPRVLASLVSWSGHRGCRPGCPDQSRVSQWRLRLFCQRRYQTRVEQQPAAVRGHHEGGDKESQSIGHKYWGSSLEPGSVWLMLCLHQHQVAPPLFPPGPRHYNQFYVQGGALTLNINTYLQNAGRAGEGKIDCWIYYW